MSDPLAGLLEGLSGGFEGGYNLREERKRNKRRERLENELATLRQLEARRAERRAQREDIVFEQGQREHQRIEDLRREVGSYLSRPQHAKTFGEFASGKPLTGRREGPPLSSEAVRAREVGRTLGQVSGADLTDEQALLVGAGDVPASALRPRGLTFEQRLELVRTGARERAAATAIKPMTRQQAAAVVSKLDTDYSEWRAGELVKHYLTPAQREMLIQKMMAGTITEDDLPDIPGEPQGGVEPTAAPATGRRTLLQRIGDVFTGGPGAAVRPPPPSGPSAMDRVQGARALIQQYRMLPPEDLEDALRAEGYSDEEIRAILGNPNE